MCAKNHIIGDHGDALVRETHNGYLASLEGKKATRESRETLEQQSMDQGQHIDQRLKALELQQTALCKVMAKFITSINSLLPDDISQVV